MEAFDYAVELQQRSDFQGNVNIQPFVRSYIYHGTLEMIDRNNYREAVWWLLETYNTVARTIMNHNVTMPNKFISRHMEFLNRLGLLTPDQKSKKEEFSRSAVTKIMHYIEHDLQIPPFT